MFQQQLPGNRNVPHTPVAGFHQTHTDGMIAHLKPIGVGVETTDGPEWCTRNADTFKGVWFFYPASTSSLSTEGLRLVRHRAEL